MAGFLGMRGTGDWTANERPLNWHQGILRLYPNGMAPLVAIMSKMREEKVDDPQFSWWTKTLPAQGGAVTNIFTDTALSVPYVSGGVAGDTVYAQAAEAVADEFRVGHQVVLRDASDPNVDVVAKVTAVVKNDASSYIACRLLEDDDNSTNGDISDVDTLLIVGNLNAEGAPIPDAIAYNPVRVYNYTQIFRNSLDITRTARKTKLRTEDAYKEAKLESLELHSIEMEKAFLYGIRSENVGANGKPERTTRGLISAIREDAAANVMDYVSDATYSGDTWLTSGEVWLDAALEQIFRYGAQEKLAFVGSGALLGINRLAKSGGQIQLQPRTVSYGIKVTEWITPFGVIYLKTHPLFSFEATTRNAMLIFEPAALRYRYVDDTTFIEDTGNTGANRVDATKEEWLTEAGMEYHHPLKFGYLTGLNQDNTA